MITYYSATPQAWKDETDDFEVGNMQTFRIFLHSEMQFIKEFVCKNLDFFRLRRTWPLYKVSCIKWNEILGGQGGRGRRTQNFIRTPLQSKARLTALLSSNINTEILEIYRSREL